jgi:3-methyladenine DNA glycosylase AlkC
LENSIESEIAYKNFKIKVKKETLKSAPRWARDEHEKVIRLLENEISDLKKQKDLPT